MTTPKKPRTHQKNVAKQRTRHTFAAGASGLAETTVLRVADLHTLATAALEEAFRKGTLSDVLGIMRDAWDGSPESLNASFVRGLAVFLARYGTQIRRAEFIEKLRSIEVRDILLRAQIIAQSMRAPTMTGVAQALLDVYNQKRSTFRLEGGFI